MQPYFMRLLACLFWYALLTRAPGNRSTIRKTIVLRIVETPEIGLICPFWYTLLTRFYLPTKNAHKQRIKPPVFCIICKVFCPHIQLCKTPAGGSKFRPERVCFPSGGGLSLFFSFSPSHWRILTGVFPAPENSGGFRLCIQYTK